MVMKLESFREVGLTPGVLEHLLREHEAASVPRYERLWGYYRNEVRLPGAASADHGSLQEIGLPARFRFPGASGEGPEKVIENDIGWRVDSLVDFVFGKPVRIRSTAEDEVVRSAVEAVLDRVWEASGGARLLQDVALLGGVYGFVDIAVRTEGLLESDEGVAAAGRARRSRGEGSWVTDEVLSAAERVRIEVVEAPRAVPFVDERDYRSLRAYAIRTVKRGVGGGVSVRGAARDRGGGGGSVAGGVGRWLSRGVHGQGLRGRGGEVIEVFSATAREVYDGGELVFSGPSSLGVLPIVHVQNTSQPFRYEGLSDVEPLIPLQDELNTRLSDRAYRVTMQSFRMLLAKGLEGFGEAPIRPGQVWTTANTDASIDAFGGDADAPSETEHIQQVRDALDKLSGVSPVVLGLLRARIGHLSSENALRVTLMGVLSKTARKRLSYGRGIAEASKLVLAALDKAGVLKTEARDRDVRLLWPDPLPTDERRALAGAERKVELGVERERVLNELGYGAEDVGVV